MFDTELLQPFLYMLGTMVGLLTIAFVLEAIFGAEQVKKTAVVKSEWDKHCDTIITD